MTAKVYALPGHQALLTPLLAILMLAMAAWADGARATTILVLGDSLSAAYGIDEELGWVALLRQRLQLEGISAEVINASVSGETSAGGRERLPALLAHYKPDLLILELGGNDGLRGYPIPAVRKNLAGIIEHSRDQGARVLLLGIQIPPNYGRRYTELFRELYPALASDLDVPLVPFFLEGVATRPDMMQSDGIHPTVAAQAQLLDNTWPRLRRLLGDLQVADNQLQ